MSASEAREMAANTKASNASVELVYDKILECAKAGYMGTKVFIPKEHIDDVFSQLANDGYDVYISEEGVYHDALQIMWEIKA